MVYKIRIYSTNIEYIFKFYKCRVKIILIALGIAATSFFGTSLTRFSSSNTYMVLKTLQDRLPAGEVLKKI
jgi:hypothetical protein